MRKLALTASFVVLVLTAVSSARQQKPNFSGTWVAVTPAQHAGGEEIIRHTATHISFHHDSSGDGHGIEYKLDGSESRNTLGDVVSVAKAMWDGDKIVIHETTTYPDGRRMQSKQTLALMPDGQMLREMTATMDGQPQAALTVTARRK